MLRKLIYETHKCRRQQAAAFSVEQCKRMPLCVCSGSAVLVVKVKKEKQIASRDANSTRVIKAFIAVLDHSTVNRPPRPAAPAKCSSALLSSSLSVVFINHKLAAQAGKQGCCAHPLCSLHVEVTNSLSRNFLKGARCLKWKISMPRA